MKKFTLLAMGLFMGVASAQNSGFEEGEILVRLTEGTNPEQFFSRNANVVISQDAEQISKVLNIWRIKVNTNSFTEKQAVREMYKDANIIDAQLNHHISLRNEPNDPRYGQQWQYYQANDRDIDADEAWEITTGGTTADGKEIVVAVLDDGVNANHPDLAANLWVNSGEIPGNGIDDDDNGFIDDVHGWNFSSNSPNINTMGWHGTPVSGIVGAVGNNDVGVAGVNWDVKIMTIIYAGVLESQVISAYDYALQARLAYNETNGEEGAFVVATNSSWGINMGQPDDVPLWCEFYNAMGEAGILSPAATANANFNIDVVGDLPTACSSEYMIAVTNTNQSDVKVNQAGYGATTIDLGAPGENAYTLTSNNYGGFGGTSGATPHVTGTVALLYSAPCNSFAALVNDDPAEAARKVRDYIFDGVDPNASLQGITVTGGRLNVNNALQLLMDECEDLKVEDLNYAEQVEIYPNPASQVLNISNKENKAIEIVEIFSMDGKLVKSQINVMGNQIQLSELPAGVYKVRIKFQGKKGLVTKKLIKK